MIRPLHFVDVAVLLLFLGKSPGEEARTRDRFGRGGRDIQLFFTLLMSCLIARDRLHSVVYSRQGLIQGLGCLRRRGGPDAWEIEHLLLAPGNHEFCVDLLEGLGVAGDKIGGERVFLRLDSGSSLADIARQAGFGHYLTEFLYRREGTPQSEPPRPLSTLRPRSPADDHGLFRLYSAAVPLQVRTAEGMTFSEWCQSWERPAAREYVCEKEGDVSAWLRIRFDGKAGQFDMVTTLEGTELAELVKSSLSLLKGRHPIYCVVPEFQLQVRHVLEEQGFHQVAEYSCLGKHRAIRVREPRLVPLRA
ncbi:MAG: hypothetical protein V3S51_08625 [Dehalococcoidia bacterium]